MSVNYNKTMITMTVNHISMCLKAKQLPKVDATCKKNKEDKHIQMLRAQQLPKVSAAGSVAVSAARVPPGRCHINIYIYMAAAI